MGRQVVSRPGGGHAVGYSQWVGVGPGGNLDGSFAVMENSEGGGFWSRVLQSRRGDSWSFSCRTGEWKERRKMIHAAPCRLPSGKASHPPPARRNTLRVSSSASVTPRAAPSTVPVTPTSRVLRAPPGAPTTPAPTTAPPVSPPDGAGAVDSAATAFWDYQGLFVSQRRETSSPVPLRTVDGAVPEDFPAGTYYLAGPGLFADDHGSTVHPLDGHGYLRSFDFESSGRGVKYSARYVETGAQKEERDDETGSWKFTHRGPFSVLKAGKKLGNMKVMKNVANTSVLVWGGRLLCLWEGGEPYELDRKTLDTVGLFDVVDKGGRTESRNGEEMATDWLRRLGELGLDAAAALLKPLLHGEYEKPARKHVSSILDLPLQWF